MAASNQSSDVSGNRDNSGGSSRPTLPLPDNGGDNVHPVSLWEIEFCRKAYDIPWETFCENQRFIKLYKNVMDWNDSGALKNFNEAKERFRANYFGEVSEDPVLDPDMYNNNEVDHYCQVDPKLIAELDNLARLARLDLLADIHLRRWGGRAANQIPAGWGQPFPNLKPTGWGETSNPTPGAASGSQGNQPAAAVGGAQPYCAPPNGNNDSNWQQQGVGPGQMTSGTGRMVIGDGVWMSGAMTGGPMRWSASGGGGIGGTVRNSNGASGGGGGGNGRNGNGSGGFRNWNCFGRGSSNSRNRNGGGKQKNVAEGQHQQRTNSGGMHRNQQRSGGQQQQQGQGRMKMEWRPVAHNRTRKDDPAA